MPVPEVPALIDSPDTSGTTTTFRKLNGGPAFQKDATAVLTISPGHPVGAVAYLSREGVEKLATECLAALGTRQALLVGGPRHGEWLDLNEKPPGSPGVYSFVTFPQAHRVDVNEAYPRQDFKTEKYYRKEGFALGKVRLPFEIYEHESLKGANKSARANELRKSSADLQQQIDRQQKELDRRHDELAHLEAEYGV